jgi:type I restriction enzyme R subunit
MTKSEAQTRSELIDQQLALAGWDVKDPSQVIKEFDILTTLPEGVFEPRTRYEGHQFSDYVLLDKARRPLAVIEAKKTSRDAAIGREQAKQYCYNIQKQIGGELPFCFYTNGHQLYFWDLENAPPRKVVGFPTRDDLERFTYIRRNRKPLTQEFINTSIAGRDYQIRAIRSVLEGIEQKKRDFLLVMATGKPCRLSRSTCPMSHAGQMREKNCSPKTVASMSPIIPQCLILLGTSTSTCLLTSLI